MAKAKKITKEDMKRFFEKTKIKLQQLGKETGIWLKKGEAELSKISKIGKLELKIVNLNIKKETLFREIGKRFVELGLGSDISDSAIKNMCSKVNAILNETKNKRAEISKLKRGLLKGRAAQGKKKK